MFALDTSCANTFYEMNTEQFVFNQFLRKACMKVTTILLLEILRLRESKQGIKYPWICIQLWIMTPDLVCIVDRESRLKKDSF